MRTAFAALVAASLAAAATAATSGTIRNSDPLRGRYRRTGTAHEDTALRFLASMPMRNLHELEATLSAVSEPLR